MFGKLFGKSEQGPMPAYRGSRPPLLKTQDIVYDAIYAAQKQQHWSQLHAFDQIIYCVNHFDSWVNTDGFDAYFADTNIGEWAMATAGLKEIGRPELAALVTEGAKVYERFEENHKTMGEHGILEFANALDDRNNVSRSDLLADLGNWISANYPWAH